MATEMNFEKELGKLINNYSQENKSHTPDFVLAHFIQGCLNSFNAAVRERDKWYHFNPTHNFPKGIGTINM